VIFAATDHPTIITAIVAESIAATVATTVARRIDVAATVVAVNHFNIIVS